MTSRERQDPYGVLGVPLQASAEEIARAYRRAARATHPDSSGSGAGADRFQVVSEAYDMLRDPERRAGYDRRHALTRRQPAGARGGSVRYAAKNSQHIVLGSQSLWDAARPRRVVRDVEEVASVRGLGDLEEMFRVVLWLLHGNR